MGMAKRWAKDLDKEWKPKNIWREDTMTREEYVQLLIKNKYPESFTKINFLILLMHVSSILFVKEEFYSILADETRRRLNQLNDLGYTDE